jgi:hypothetical protein
VRFYNAVRGRVARVVVVNPQQFQAISASVKKSNRHDPEALASYSGQGLWPGMGMKQNKQRELNHLAQMRDLLVKQRAAPKALARGR